MGGSLVAGSAFSCFIFYSGAAADICTRDEMNLIIIHLL